MNEEATIFPLPAGASLSEQAEALARAAWLMAAPGETNPPASSAEDAPAHTPDESRNLSDNRLSESSSGERALSLSPPLHGPGGFHACDGRPCSWFPLS